jgi:hypothetical protein
MPPENAPVKHEKDLWDKLDVILKGVAAVLISVAITGYGIYSENRRSHEAEENRRSQVQQAEGNRAAQAVIQALGTRETVSAEMRAKMFDTLIQHYFKSDERSQLVVLELLALNFQDIFQLRPLFDRLDLALKGRPDDRQELRRIARNVVRRQVDGLVGSGGAICELTLDKDVWSPARCGLPIAVKLVDVSRERIRVGVAPAGDTSSMMGPFEVSYFDMPFTDNSTLFEATYSIVLSDTAADQKKATVQLVIFPRHYYNAQNRLRLDKLIGNVLDTVKPQ